VRNMDVSTYFYFVVAAAIVYLIIMRFVQNRLMSKDLVAEVQLKSKQLNEIYKQNLSEARKTEEINKINSELLPKMNQMMMGQFKMMFVILILFTAFTWFVGYMDPTSQDDIALNLTNQGNYTFSGQVPISSSTDPLWYATFRAFSGTQEISSNQSVFFTGPKTEQELLWIKSSGIPMGVGTDKEFYSPGEIATLFAHVPENTTSVSATVNMGTRFYVDLPATIPLLNIRRIYDSQGWFIFSTFVLGLFLNTILSRIEKKKAPEEKKTA